MALQQISRIICRGALTSQIEKVEKHPCHMNIFLIVEKRAIFAAMKIKFKVGMKQDSRRKYRLFQYPQLQLC